MWAIPKRKPPFLLGITSKKPFFKEREEIVMAKNDVIQKPDIQEARRFFDVAREPFILF